MADQLTGNKYEEKNKKSILTYPIQNDRITDGINKKHSVTVLTSPEMAFAFWRDFSNFPLFMKDVAEVRILSPKISHWVIKMERGPTIEWDAEIIHEREGEMITWQSIEAAPVKQAGSVWFKSAPGNLGTEVCVALSYTIPGGKFTELASKLIGEDPDTLIQTNLRRFKAYIETGEIPTTEGQPNSNDEDISHSDKH